MPARTLRLLGYLALIAIFGICGYWSLRVAWAERLATSESRRDVTRALRLAPDNAAAHLQMATLLDGSREDPRRELARAAALKPDDYRIWMRLAAENEARGDPSGAEACLLRAAAAGRRFEPRWRMANFYFRRGDAERFWPWAREALLQAYDDPAAVFRLCRRMPRADEQMERILPDQPRLLAAYLRYLSAGDDLAHADGIARQLLRTARPEDLPELLAYCDRSLAAQRADSALQIWNGLAQRRLIPYPALDPEHGSFVTNGEFARTPLGAGFDWYVAASLAGVTSVRLGESGGLRITFSGRQPENCDLLAQRIPPGASERRLQIEYRTGGIAAGSGLRWVVLDSASGKELAAAPLSSDSWTGAEMRFPPRLARMLLSYRRAPGTTRIEGWIELRRVRS